MDGSSELRQMSEIKERQDAERDSLTESIMMIQLTEVIREISSIKKQPMVNKQAGAILGQQRRCVQITKSKTEHDKKKQNTI